MVLNLKIDQAREEHDLFIPYTDGKGPISRLNLRRLKIDRYRKLFGNMRAEDNKMHKYINELCREYDIGPKSKMIDLKLVNLMLKNVTDMWSSVYESLKTNSIDYRLEMNSFKDFVKELIKEQ